MPPEEYRYKTGCPLNCRAEGGRQSVSLHRLSEYLAPSETADASSAVPIRAYPVGTLGYLGGRLITF